MNCQCIGVVGAGTMGIGISVDLVIHGLDCVLVDVSRDILTKAESEIVNGVRFASLVKKDAPKATADQALERVTFTTHLNRLGNCDFIVENVTEDWSIKEPIYRQLEDICSPEVCFAANTSCISITRLGRTTQRPDKVIGMHFMNPVFMKPFVEVIKGCCTSEETVSTATLFLSKLAKEAIIVDDYPGFVSNRISHLFMNEAAFVLQDGVATARQIDDIFKKCFGHAMGPLETADLIGLDTVVNSIDVLYQSYQDSKYRCCPLLRKMVEAGRLGRKSGKGFYDYK